MKKMLGFRWFKNSKGQPDATLTFASLGFYVVSVVILLSVIKTLTVAGTTFEFHQPNDVLLLGYLGAVFSSYVVRRNTADKLDSQKATVEVSSSNDMPGGLSQ